MKTQGDIEHIVNLAYPGLRLMVRDANLRRAAEKYAQGMLLFQPEPTEGSLMMGGLADADRYAILSNNFEEFPGEDDGLERCLIPAGAHFKVLDVYRKLGHTQIALLHLPEAHWRFFEEVETNLDDLLVDYVREHFEALLDQPPHAAQTAPHWRKRCRHLIGMTDLGAPHPLE